MRIAIVGTGAVGEFYARRWVASGHEVTCTFSRDPEALADRAASIGAASAPPADAVADADVVLFSVPFETIADAAAQLGDLAGKVVIDSTNPFNPDRSSVVDLGAGETAFQVVSRALPGARVVKALHNLGVAQLEDPGVRPAAFVISPDDEAQKTVAALVHDAGLAPVETGDLSNVAATEAPGSLFTAVLDEDQARSALRA